MSECRAQRRRPHTYSLTAPQLQKVDLITGWLVALKLGKNCSSNDHHAHLHQWMRALNSSENIAQTLQWLYATPRS